MAFYKKRIVKEDTQEQVDERIAFRAAAKQAFADMQAMFPIVSGDNFAAAWAFQQKRLAELLKG